MSSITINSKLFRLSKLISKFYGFPDIHTYTSALSVEELEKVSEYIKKRIRQKEELKDLGLDIDLSQKEEELKQFYKYFNSK